MAWRESAIWKSMSEAASRYWPALSQWRGVFTYHSERFKTRAGPHPVLSRSTPRNFLLVLSSLNKIWNIYVNYGLVQGLWFSFLFVFFFPHWLILNLELQILVLHKTRGTRHNLMLIVYYLRMHIIRSNIRIRLWDNLYVCILSNIVYVYYIQFRKDFGALREKKN